MPSAGRSIHLRDADDVDTIYAVRTTCVQHRPAPTTDAGKAALAEILCPSWKATGTCPQGLACPHTHANLAKATTFNAHRRTDDAKYDRLTVEDAEGAETLTLALPNETEATDEVPTAECYATKAIVTQRRPLSHCAHFLQKGICHLGSQCRFVHVAKPSAAAVAWGVASAEQRTARAEAESSLRSLDERQLPSAGQSSEFQFPQTLSMPQQQGGQSGQSQHPHATPFSSLSSLLDDKAVGPPNQQQSLRSPLDELRADSITNPAGDASVLDNIAAAIFQQATAPPPAAPSQQQQQRSTPRGQQRPGSNPPERSTPGQQRQHQQQQQQQQQPPSLAQPGGVTLPFAPQPGQQPPYYQQPRQAQPQAHPQYAQQQLPQQLPAGYAMPPGYPMPQMAAGGYPVAYGQPVAYAAPPGYPAAQYAYAPQYAAYAPQGYPYPVSYAAAPPQPGQPVAYAGYPPGAYAPPGYPAAAGAPAPPTA